MKKIQIILILLFFLLSIGIYAVDQDDELGRLYARYAWDAYSKGKWKDFVELSSKGFEYDTNNPDLLCFHGIESLEAGLYLDAETWFTKAYYSSYQSEQVSSKDILGWLFEVNYRLGNDRKIETLFYSISELTRDDPEILYYTVLSLDRLGQKVQALELAANGVYRYQDQRFLILLCSWSDDNYYSGILSEYINRQGIRYPDLMARTILTPGTKNVSSLASLYIEQFNDLNSWYFKSLFFNLPADTDSIPDFSDSQRIWPLVALQKYIETSSGMNHLLKNISNMAVDSTMDGIADFFMKSIRGEVIWESDPDQDGIIDSRLIWNSSAILKSIEYRSLHENRLVHYYQYPYIDRVSISGTDRTLREYNFLPGSFEYPLSQRDGSLYVSLVLDPQAINQGFLPESSILKQSFSLIDSVTKPKITPFREYTVVDGMIKRFREDSNFDGNFDRIVLLKDWLPYEGYRDIDGDGSLDIKEKYTVGRFVGFIYEGEKGLLEEYHDLWNKKKYQLWDFTRDGFYNALLEQKSDGSWNEILLDSHD